MSKKRYLKGFTLSEVLIALVIIGVIAAITVPALNNSTNKQETVAKVKKIYSVMNQALIFAMIKHGGPVDSWGFDEDYYNPESLVSYFKPYLNIIKDCGVRSGCIADSEYRYLNGSVWTGGSAYDSSNVYYKMILNDGSYVWIRNNKSSECLNDDGGVENVCGLIWIDTNGKKRPNTLGKDVFVFQIMRDRIIPNESQICTTSLQGWGCSGYILKHDNMNYPSG